MQVTILPVFLMLKKMGLLNKLAGVLFLYIAGISMSCIVFQKFFKTLPRELEESARMDGCHDVKAVFPDYFPDCEAGDRDDGADQGHRLLE